MTSATSVITRIKACLNGGRRRDEHPAVPVTADELAAAAVGAVDAGAEALHVHPRDRAGAETLNVNDVGAAVAAVRRASPGVPIGVSTGLWIVGGDVSRRSAGVSAWTELPVAGRPDFASVNVSEAGGADLAGVLLGAGIEVEAGVWSPADASALAAAGDIPWTRLLIEILDATGETAVGAADAILARLDELGVPGARLLHGENAACWPLVTHAGRLGLPTRIGFEDTLVGPDGAPVADNADLVRLALGEWTRAT